MKINYPNSDKTFAVDELLVKKIDVMCKLIEESSGDAVIIADGGEGTGKSNLLSIVCYLFSIKLNRRYTSDDIYFDLDEMMKEVQSSKERIFHFDEAALGALAGDWQNSLQKKFIKLLMIARKRKHIICMAVPQFWRLNRYFAVDRSKALLHTYLHQGIKHGKYSYYTLRGKEVLYDEIKRKRNSLAYRSPFSGSKGRMGKHGCFIGNTAYQMDKLIDFAAYDKKKDRAIESLTEHNEDRRSVWEEIFYREYEEHLKLGCVKTQEYYGKKYGKAQRTIGRSLQKDKFKDLIRLHNNTEKSLEKPPI